jgi:hypothetical protein
MSEPTSQKGYEVSDARFHAIMWGGGALVILMILAFVLMYVLLGHFESRQQAIATPPSPLLEGRPLPPQPRLQVTPEIDLKTLRAKEDSLLNSYGWVSKEAGVVRIPVDRAMKLILERGFPAREPENGNRGVRQ